LPKIKTERKQTECQSTSNCKANFEKNKTVRPIFEKTGGKSIDVDECRVVIFHLVTKSTKIERFWQFFQQVDAYLTKIRENL